MRELGVAGKWLMIQRISDPSESEGTEIRDSTRLIPCTTTMLEKMEVKCNGTCKE